MLLTHNLSTIELGSISWRQVINQNFVYLDNNRIFVVEADANLPTSEFKNGRFFYSKATKSFWHDNGTLLTKVAGGTEINLSGNPDKFIKINAAGTALEYVDITSGGLSNRVDPTVAATLNSLYVSTDNPTTSNFTKASEIVNFGYNNIFLLENNNGTSYSSVIGSSNNICGYYNNVFGNNNKITKSICTYTNVIGYNNKNIKHYSSNVIGYNNDLNSLDYSSSINIIGTNNSLNSSKAIYDSIIIGSNNKSNFSQSILIGKGVESKNSLSINKGFNNYNGRILRELTYHKNPLNSSSLTNIYIDNSNESINLTSNTFNNISGNITIFDKINQNCKKIKVDLIIFVNSGGTINIKQFIKTTIFEDSVYSIADINFLTTSSNTLTLQVNTNSISSSVVAKLDIEEFNTYY